MIDWLNTISDAIFASTLMLAVVVLWSAYRNLVDRLLALQSQRIVELVAEIEKLKRRDPSAPSDPHDLGLARPLMAAPRVVERTAAVVQ